MTANINNISDKNIHELGDVKIADDVVASIAGLAAAEVNGVASMSGNVSSDIIGMFGIKNSQKGVKVEISERKVIVTLFINIHFGYSIPKTSLLVQEKVKNAIENMTGLDVPEVNVHVVGIVVNQ